MVAYHPKARHLTIMPDISGEHAALLHDFSPKRKETSCTLRLDFSLVKKVDSIGLAVLLGIIFLEKEHPENYDVKIIWSKYEYVNEILNELCLPELIATLRANAQTQSTVDIFYDLQNSGNFEVLKDSKTDPIPRLQKILLFIPEKPNTPNNRQNGINAFSKSLKAFLALDTPRTFNHEQIIKVFLELAKNTYDHSNGIGIAGFNISKGLSSNKLLQFVYCDTGEGICQNVRRYLSSSDNVELKRLAIKGGVVDFIHKAFQPGFSTKDGNGVNYGMGLTLIIQGALGCGFHDIRLRDAHSFIDLSQIESSSHSQLRQFFSKTTAPKLLMFYFGREIHAS